MRHRLVVTSTCACRGRNVVRARHMEDSKNAEPSAGAAWSNARHPQQCLQAESYTCLVRVRPLTPSSRGASAGRTQIAVLVRPLLTPSCLAGASVTLRPKTSSSHTRTEGAQACIEDRIRECLCSLRAHRNKNLGQGKSYENDSVLPLLNLCSTST